MNDFFDFPTMPKTPSIRIDYNNLTPASTLQKKIENELQSWFIQSKASCKFYILQITEKFISIEEFTDNTFFCCTTDLIVESYYDPNGTVLLSYIKTDRIKLSHHLLNLRK